MINFPNAKINLGLNVTSKRTDGYHNLETIFYPIELKDALEIVPASNKASVEFKNTAPVVSNAIYTDNPIPVIDNILSSSNQKAKSNYRFFLSGEKVQGDPESNLVIKALNLISSKTKIEIPPIDIHLLKNIPQGSGLGGGSSNAAFMLKLLNEYFKLNFSLDELLKIASNMGADCPFFLINKPVFASGIGNQMTPVNVDLNNYFLLIVKPEITVSTKDAYGMITPGPAKESLEEIVKKPISQWKELMKNDFEEPIFKKYPEICVIKQQLYELGAIYASMSGSGSSVYGLFENRPNWGDLFKNHFVWVSE